MLRRGICIHNSRYTFIIALDDERGERPFLWPLTSWMLRRRICVLIYLLI